jgi:tRNA A-37 threonylcarbamoyl transferase component Bud32
MNKKDYDFWSVGNEQLSLQNHFPKHIPVIQYLSHSGAESPAEPSNTNANNYTCAEPEILRKSLESALKVAHDEIEKYQLTLNENTAKKLLEATAQGAFRDDPNIMRNAHTQYANPKEYKQSKLRLMDLFIPPIKEEEGEPSGIPINNQSRRSSAQESSRRSSAQANITPKMMKSPSFNERIKRNSTPSILSSSMFQPPTPKENKKPPLYNGNALKPPIIPIKKDPRHSVGNANKKNNDVLTQEEIDQLTTTSPKGKSQSFSFSNGPSSPESYTENEESVTTIKSNINAELLQLLNKYCPPSNKSQKDLEDNNEPISTENSAEQLRKSSEDIKSSNNTLSSEEVEESKEGSSTESTSDDEKEENVMEDSFLPSNVHKKNMSDGDKKPNEKEQSSGIASSSKKLMKSISSLHHSRKKLDQKENGRPSLSVSIASNNTADTTATESTITTSNSKPESKSKSSKKKKHKKNIIKDIFSPIKNIFSDTGKSISRSSSRKTKSNEALSRSGSEMNSPDVPEDESKYKLEEVLGKGANAVVKLAKSSYTGNIKNLDSEKYYAIKQFRKRRKNEPYKAYIKKVISEFCISSSLKHQNVVETVDLIQDKNENWCEVMEYCSGGDLYTRINTGTLTNKDEMNCYFKQLLMGVAYLHSVGVCHRDIKPENLLMDETGTILKITDFGVSEVFRFPWEKNVIKRVSGLCGSEPYIAPEEWSEDKDYDPIKVDIWACAIVFYTMNHMSVPWRQANSSDKYYDFYLNHRSNFSPIEELPAITHEVLYHMLDPNPETRWPMEKVLESDWIRGITACGGYKGEGPSVSGDGHAHTSKWKV